MKHPEWKRIIATVREMRADPKLAGMTAEARERFIWAELDRLYPTLQTSVQSSDTCLLNPDPAKTCESKDSESGRIRGLAEVPDSWGELPSNASMAAEIGWVQAERLRIVEEKPSGAIVVHLGRARTAAPSWAALSWLETSIRSYAKFVEVAAKAAGGQTDEVDQVRRERMQIEEIRAILLEMRDAGRSG